VTNTDFDDLLDNPITTKNQATSTAIIGTPITASELKTKITDHTYAMLTDADDDNGSRAIESAEVQAGAIMAKFGRPLDRDNQVDRDVIILLAIWELFLRVGQAGAGREYRIKAKDLIIAAYGEFPDSQKPDTTRVVAGSVFRPERKEFP
jgi:hypothetical protein